MYVDLECVYTLKCGVRIPRFKSSLFPNNKCAGATLVRLLTELLVMRCTNGIELAYPSRVCLSKTRPRKCLFTSLLTLSTIAFSCFEYERVKLCGVLKNLRNILSNRLRNGILDPILSYLAIQIDQNEKVNNHPQILRPHLHTRTVPSIV